MTHGRWTLAAIAAVAAIGAVLAGCGGGDQEGRRGNVEALPTSSCPTAIVYEGEGDPTYLIASDLPLQNPQLPQVAQMGKAIEFVLEQRDFTAGDKRVAYQACDDSTAQAAAWDSARCSANANAYAANAAVIGIIGTYDSGCAKLVLPVLNGKSIAMVSPTNTYVGLTQGGPVAPGEPSKYFPSGRRTYARVIAADNVQGPGPGDLREERPEARQGLRPRRWPALRRRRGGRLRLSRLEARPDDRRTQDVGAEGGTVRRARVRDQAERGGRRLDRRHRRQPRRPAAAGSARRAGHPDRDPRTGRVQPRPERRQRRRAGGRSACT